MGLDWCLESTEEELEPTGKMRRKMPIEYLGAERCDLNRIDHRIICRQILKSYDRECTPAALKEMEGKVLVPTIDREKYRDVLPALDSPFSLLSGVEAFRGKRIQYCNELLPTDLRDAAFMERDRDEMREYADELEHYLPDDLKGVTETELMTREKVAAKAERPTNREWEALAIKEAVAWLRFWAQYPVQLKPWW